MSEPFDPYYRWLGIRDSQRPPNHYRLLGLEPFESEQEVIEAAFDRQMTFVRTFQNGPHAELSQRLLNELSQARICLLNKEKRAVYDEALRGSLAPTTAPAAPYDPALNRRTEKQKQFFIVSGLVAAGFATLVGATWAMFSWTTPVEPHRTKLVTSHEANPASTSDAAAEALDKPLPLTSTSSLAAHQISVWALGLSRDGQKLISGSADGTVRTWHAESGKPDRLIDDHQTIVACVAVSPDGNYAASSDVDGQAYIWRLDKAEPLFEHKFEPAATALAISPDGLSIAVGLPTGQVVIWSIGSGDVGEPIPVQGGKIQALAWYDESRFLAAGVAPEVRLVHRDGKAERLYPIVGGVVNALAASAKTSQFVSAGQDGTIDLWTIDAASPVRTMTGHTGPVRSLSLTADGRGLLSGSEDGTARYWDLTTGRELAASAARKALRVLAVVVAPGGRKAWTAGTEPAIRVWDLPEIPASAPSP